MLVDKDKSEREKIIKTIKLIGDRNSNYSVVSEPNTFQIYKFYDKVEFALKYSKSDDNEISEMAISLVGKLIDKDLQNDRYNYDIHKLFEDFWTENLNSSNIKDNELGVIVRSYFPNDEDLQKYKKLIDYIASSSKNENSRASAYLIKINYSDNSDILKIYDYIMKNETNSLMYKVVSRVGIKDDGYYKLIAYLMDDPRFLMKGGLDLISGIKGDVNKDIKSDLSAKMVNLIYKTTKPDIVDPIFKKLININLSNSELDNESINKLIKMFDSIQIVNGKIEQDKLNLTKSAFSANYLLNLYLMSSESIGKNIYNKISSMLLIKDYFDYFIKANMRIYSNDDSLSYYNFTTTDNTYDKVVSDIEFIGFNWSKWDKKERIDSLKMFKRDVNKQLNYMKFVAANNTTANFGDFIKTGKNPYIDKVYTDELRYFFYGTDPKIYYSMLRDKISTTPDR